MWSLDTALVFIREHQKPCMDRGYYLALAGGVLNKGHSDDDLDLVAVPMKDTSKFTDIHKYIETLGPLRIDYTLPACIHITMELADSRRVEIAVITGDGL